MSEPWAHPERAENNPQQPTGEAPERVSVNDTGPQPAQPVEQPQQEYQAPPADQSTQQFQSQPQPQPEYHQPQQQYQGQTQQYVQQQQQPQYVAPKKKSGIFGLIALLLVVLGYILVIVAMAVSFSNFEFSEEYFARLAAGNVAGTLILALAIGSWLLGSLLCLIALIIRRGVIASVIGLFLVLVPSWMLGLAFLFAAMGSTAFMTGLLD